MHCMEERYARHERTNKSNYICIVCGSVLRNKCSGIKDSTAYSRTDINGCLIMEVMKSVSGDRFLCWPCFMLDCELPR